ncbi:MAG: SRPBCC family protein [Bacteroidia bacterium]
MKIIKIILKSILVLIIVVLVAGVFMKKEFNYEKSISINAPSDLVWENILYFKNHDKWSQWKEIDPNMKEEITGTDGTVGAKATWSSNHKEVGNGSQTITAIVPGKRVDTKLEFDGQDGGTGFFTVDEENGATKVVWGMHSEIPYPINAMSFMFMPSDEDMNQMFEKGLAMLKKASEEQK